MIDRHEKRINNLAAHLKAFNELGLGTHSGHFEGEADLVFAARYYEWSNKAADLIRHLLEDVEAEKKENDSAAA